MGEGEVLHNFALCTLNFALKKQYNQTAVLLNLFAVILFTYPCEVTYFTLGFACVAHGSAVEHAAVAEIVAFLGREELFELDFNLVRVFCFYQTEAV